MQRRGTGNLLVEHFVDVARSRGSTSIHVVGNPHAESFYRACGFESQGPSYLGGGRPALSEKTEPLSPYAGLGSPVVPNRIPLVA